MFKGTTEAGTIKCTTHGEITSIDCTCLREGQICKGCLIFESLKNDENKETILK